MSLIFSSEQSAIINCSKDETDVNVVVDAVAGSGKTTTICGIVRHNIHNRILILTYNRHLCQETSARLQFFNLKNADIFTLHGFVYSYYNNADYTDRIIRDTLTHDLPLRKEGIKYDMIILDEFQDFNMHMLQTVVKYIRDVMLLHRQWKPRLYLLGDKYQCVYEDLHSSDNRFLIHAPTLFNIFGKWKRFSLQTTYRLTDKMVDFMNRAILRSEFFLTNKIGIRKPHYVICNPFSAVLHEWLYDFILQNHYKPDDIFILAPSIKNGNSPVYQFTNVLSENGFPIFYSNQFDDLCNVKETENKVTVNTFHVCKGRERPLVIIFNVDASYFQWFAKDKSNHECTNPQYVSFTRGLTDLILIQNQKDDHLPFMNFDEVKSTCEVVLLNNKQEKKSNSEKKELLSVVELLDYLTFDVIRYADQFYTCDVEYTGNAVNLPSFVQAKMNDLQVVENVSNLNGNLITLISEYEMTGRVGMLEHCDLVGKVLSENSKDIRKLWVEIKSQSASIYRKLVNVSLLLEVESTGATHRLRQITNKNWLNEDHWKDIVEKFTAETGGKTGTTVTQTKHFEKKVVDDDVIRGKRLYGRVDFIDDDTKTIYECKWVSKVTDVHKIQVLIYYYLLCKMDEKYYDYTIVLINFRDGARYTLKIIDVDLFPLVDYFVYMKYATKPKLSFEDLEKSTRGMIEKYFHSDCTPKQVEKSTSGIEINDKSQLAKPVQDSFGETV